MFRILHFFRKTKPVPVRIENCEIKPSNSFEFQVGKTISSICIGNKKIPKLNIIRRANRRDVYRLDTSKIFNHPF
jgi:hypothetical protein